MFKFLRKYQTWILAVGGTLLMIVFLIPQAITAWSQQAGVSSATIATLSKTGESIDGAEWDEILQEMRVLSDMQRLDPIFFFPLLYVGGVNTPEHWYLLSEEARRAGLVPSAFSTNSQDDLNSIANAIGQPAPIVARVLNKMQGIRQMLSLYDGVAEISDARLRERARRMLSAVQIRMLAIPADPEADGLPNPTEADIQAQFDAYKDDLPGEGDRGFGYRYADRIQLEWISIAPADIEQWIEDQGIDDIELRRHWVARQGEPRVPMIDPNNAGADVPDAVIRDFKDIRAQEMMNTLRQDIRMALQAPLREVPRKDNAYVLPADWDQQKVSFEELALQLQEKRGIPLPTYESRQDRWYLPTELTDLGLIGFASNEEFSPGTRHTVETMVPLLSELDSDSLVKQQVGVTLPLLTSTLEQTLFVARITAVDPSHAPESVDEVRDTVVNDINRIAHYEQLAADLDSIESFVRENGFLKGAVEYNAPVQQDRSIGIIDPAYVNNLRIGRAIQDFRMPDLPIIGRQESVVNAVIDTAIAFGDQKLPDIPVEDRILSFDVSDALAVAVIMLEHEVPLGRETFDQIVANQSLQRLLIATEAEDETSIIDTFGYDALADRYGFERTAATDDEETENGEIAEDA